MSPLLVALLLACRSEPPAVLPAPVLAEPTATGRMVRSGTVSGYIARPLAAGSGRTGTLVLAEAHDETSRAAALALAEAGGVALVVVPGTDPAAAQAYLSGMPDVASVVVDCRRASCP